MNNLVRMLTVAVALAILSGLAFADEPSEEARRLTREGLAAMKSENFELALAKFRDAQVESPDSPRLHFNVGMALYRLERWDEARTAFAAAAAVAREKEIEKRAKFWLGNTAVKAGKFTEALKHLNEAVDLDDVYEDAKVNREWVIRKIQELARKKKEQQDREKKERKIAEMLQELIGRQTRAHLATRETMIREGLDVARSRIAWLEEVLNQPLDRRDELDAAEEVDVTAFFSALEDEQAAILDEASTVLDTAKARLEAGAANGAPGAPPASGGSPDPELEKLGEVVPILEGVLPILDGAVAATRDADFAELHTRQEDALEQLLRALDLLLDELTRIIRDQVALFKAGDATWLSSEEGGSADPISADDLRARGSEQASRQDGLHERTTRFTQSVEQAVIGMREQQSAQGTQVGAEPGGPDLDRMDKALGHLLAATQAMERASSNLREPAFKSALVEEKTALEELVKAKQMLSPPQEQQGDSGEKSDQEQEKEDGEQQEGDQNEKKDGDEGDNSKEGEPNEQEQQNPRDQSEDSGEEGEKKTRERESSAELTREQAEKMLERARQSERDRRKASRDEGRRVEGGAGGAAKDW